MRFVRYTTMLALFLLAVASTANAGGNPITCVHDFGPFC